MQWLLQRLFRPTTLVLLAGLALAAAALLVWPRSSDQARPLPVAPGDQEIVWLNHATNVRDWERFVTAVLKAKPDGLRLQVDDSRAFPRETTEVPEIKLKAEGKQGWLAVRWYKLTGDLKTEDWVAALAQRSPPPLAIIGGSNSQSALELARVLQKNRTGPDSPLFLITQASAEKDPSAQGEPPLIEIYEGKTFRFCFSNWQMALIVTDFVWNRDHLLPSGESLRPDPGPAYMPIWTDDPFSVDLAETFLEALAVRHGVQEVAYLAGVVAAGGPALQAAAAHPFPLAGYTPAEQARIDYSAGSFSRPNPNEEQTANFFLKQLLGGDQQQALLVLPATSQPARRFLRALRKNAPVASRNFVVVTGDSIDFNKIYRDRNLTWPIQDLPLRLVFFCHRNPVNRELGFREQATVKDYDPAKGSPTSGTEDLLLFIDVVEAVARAAYQGPALLTRADDLARNLHRVTWKGVRPHQGLGASVVGLGASPLGTGPWSGSAALITGNANVQTLFNAKGNRRGGTGEHLVYLRPPLLVNNRVAPRAELEIWYRSRESPGRGAKSWKLRRSLAVDYGSGPGEGG